MNEKGMVLVIEDDEAIQALLEGMLKLEGYKVLCAYDGVGGLTEASLNTPVAIFLDLRLPLMDGETFIATYHQMMVPHAPIIGMSVYSQPHINPQLAAFMKKPFTLEQVRTIMDVVLRRYADV